MGRCASCSPPHRSTDRAKRHTLGTESAQTRVHCGGSVVCVLDLLLPLHCAVCRSVGAAICAACKALLVRLAPPLCARCGAPGAWPVERCAECAGRRIAFASARAAILYDERCAQADLGLEGAWPAAAGRGGGDDRRRGARPAGRGRAHVRARAEGANAQARSPSGRGPGARARASVGPPGGGARGAYAAGRAPARSRSEGAAAERRRCLRAGACVAGHRLSRRRHLHQRGHCGGGGDRAPEGRCAPGRGGHARAGSSLTGSVATRYSLGTTGREETHATSGQRPECRGQRFDPEVCRGEARQARAAARRSDTGGARARPRAQPVHRRGPHRGGDDLDEGPDTARARELRGVRGVDRPAREQARAAGGAVPREAQPTRDRRGERTDRCRRSRSSRPSSSSR